MTARARWFLTAIAVWGVPAFLLLLGTRFFFRQEYEQRISISQQGLARSLEIFSDTVCPEVFFPLELRRKIRTLWGMPISNPGFPGNIRHLLKSFPKGGVSLLLFDFEGRMVFPVADPLSASWEEIFRFITRPLDAIATEPSQAMRTTNHLFRDIRVFLDSTRGKDGRLSRINFGEKEAPQFPTWSISFRNPRPGKGFAAGAIILIYQRSFSRYFFFDSLARQARFRGSPLGFVLHPDREEEAARRMRGMGRKNKEDAAIAGSFFPGNGEMQTATAHFPEFLDQRDREILIGKLRDESSRSFGFGDFLVESRSLDHGDLVFGLKRMPTPPFWGFLGFLGAFCLSSFLFLRHLFLVIKRESEITFSLKTRMLFFFLLALGLPLVLSISLGFLLTRETREEVLFQHRREAFQRLEHLDGAFPHAVAQIERIYRKLCGEFGSSPAEKDRIVRLLSRLQAKGILDDFYIIPREQEPMISSFSMVPFEWAPLFRLPGKHRLKMIRELANDGQTLGLQLLNGLIDAGNYGRLVEPRTPKAFRDLWEKAFQIWGRNFLAEFGSPDDPGSHIPPSETGISPEALLPPETEFLADNLRTNFGKMYQIRHIPPPLYLFSGIVKGPGNRGRYALFISHSEAGLCRWFLQRVLERDAKSGFSPLKAISTGQIYPPCLPRIEDSRWLRPIVNRLGREKTHRFAGSLKIGKKEHEVCILRGKNITDFFLVHCVPSEILDFRARKFLRQLQAIIFGVCLFSMILVWAFFQKLFRPLEDLSAGVKAIRNKDFGFRIISSGNDELASLCREFNRASQHLGEMEIASAIQSSILPPPHFQAGAFIMHGLNRMTQAIGGDYFDFITLEDGKIAVVVGDVTGHGIGAALVTAMAKAGFTILANRHSDSPQTVLARLNAHFFELLKRKKGMTCFLGILDPVSGTIDCASAGHCFPIWVNRGAKPAFLDGQSSPLGIFSRARTFSKRVNLNEGTLFLYTDGLVEAESPNEEPLGFERFFQIVGRALKGEESDPLPAVFADVRSFTGNLDWQDDATAVVVRKRR